MGNKALHEDLDALEMRFWEYFNEHDLFTLQLRVQHARNCAAVARRFIADNPNIVTDWENL